STSYERHPPSVIAETTRVNNRPAPILAAQRTFPPHSPVVHDGVRPYPTMDFPEPRSRGFRRAEAGRQALKQGFCPDVRLPADPSSRTGPFTALNVLRTPSTV